jgi:hypothetical protein
MIEENKYTDFTSLVGETVLNVEWNSERVIFHCETGSHIFEAYGDCCSVSWIETFDNADQLKGEILSIEELELPQEPEGLDLSNYDVLAIYGYSIKTEKGQFVLDFRNDSNGYYGGSLDYSGKLGSF